MIHFEIELINFVTKHHYLDSKWIQKKSNLSDWMRKKFIVERPRDIISFLRLAILFSS